MTASLRGSRLFQMGRGHFVAGEPLEDFKNDNRRHGLDIRANVFARDVCEKRLCTGVAAQLTRHVRLRDQLMMMRFCFFYCIGIFFRRVSAPGRFGRVNRKTPFLNSAFAFESSTSAGSRTERSNEP